MFNPEFNYIASVIGCAVLFASGFQKNDGAHRAFLGVGLFLVHVALRFQVGNS